MTKNTINSKTKVAIIIIGLLITMMASSIKGLYQVYFIDLLTVYNMNRMELSFLGAMFGISIGFFSPITGYLCDKYGASKVIFSGVITAIFVFGLLSISTSRYLLFLSLGILSAYSLTAMTFIPFGILIDNSFKNKKGVAFAILSNGSSIGFIILSPLWVYFNEYFSWQYSNFIVFIFFFLIVLPISFILIKITSNEKNDIKPENHKSKQLFKKLKSFQFLFLSISFGGCGASMAFIDVHYIALIKENFNFYLFNDNSSLSVFSLSVLGIAELLGSLLIVLLIRHLNIYLSLAFLYFIRVTLFIMLFFFKNDLIYLGFSIIFGLTYMGTVIIGSLLCFRWYGLELKGQIFGYLFLFHQLFAFLSVSLGGYFYDLFGNYNQYLIILSVLSGTSVIMSLLLYLKKQIEENNKTM